MEYRKLFAEPHRHPKLYGLDGSYRDYCTFLAGVDAGNNGQVLTGFRESLVPRVGNGDNLTWTSLVLHLAFPDHTAGWHEEAAGEGRQIAVDLLFSLLDEFWERRAAPDGTGRHDSRLRRIPDVAAGTATRRRHPQRDCETSGATPDQGSAPDDRQDARRGED
jgi:hypothetical protein